MSCPVCKIKYSGTAPGADASTYELFSTVTAGWADRLATHSGYSRIVVSLLGDATETGTLQLQKRTSSGSWVTVHDDAVTFATGEAQVYDYLIAQYDQWRVNWVNGGSPQSQWEVDLALVPDTSPTQ